MKKKNAKPEHLKINQSKSENAKCTCIDNGEIGPSCKEAGICPTLNAVGIRGFKYKDKRGVRKEFKEFGKGIEAFRKIFKSMKKKP